jgi:predicted DCC family thiol-disulfide oxidoreductase YuxK
MNKGKKIILFDGICNLCNRSVQFIIKHDRKNQFCFGSLQGVAGQGYLKKFQIKGFPLKSILLVEEGKLYTASSAVLRICKFLGRGWQICYLFIIIPKFIRDQIYFLIAKNRYRWFGKKDSCWLPEPGQSDLFLE